MAIEKHRQVEPRPVSIRCGYESAVSHTITFLQGEAGAEFVFPV